MKNDLNQLFKKLPSIAPTEELAQRIMKKIREEREKMIWQKLWLTRLSLGGSVVVLVLTIFVFGQNILTSDFWKMASLIFTDYGIVANYWQEFALSLLENVPIVALIAVLIPVFLLFLVAGFYLDLLNKIKRHKFV